jgi:uncharacterized repeat protein (TIGR03803 family)
MVLGAADHGGIVNASCPVGCGVIYQVDPASGVETVLYSFTGGADGADLRGTLVYHDNALYGTAYGGGQPGCSSRSGCGTFYELDLATSRLTVLHAFSGGADGAAPNAGLLYSNGVLYGTTSEGGDAICDCGTAFAIAL